MAKTYRLNQNIAKTTGKPTKDSAATRSAKSAGAKAAATARAHAKLSAANAGQVGFMGFFRQQGVIGLAIGLVIGTQVKLLVDQLIASFINPILGLILPGQGDLSQKTFTLTISHLNKTAIFSWGQFVYVLISFIAVAIIIYYIIHGLKLDKIDMKK